MRWQLSAKVNWTLDVLGRRPDGFHELRSWFLALDWGDTLSFKARLGQSLLEMTGPFASGVPRGEHNLLMQAESLWRKSGGVAPFLTWTLEKQVPAGAGLGGGSSDAAAALHALQKVASTALSDKRCAQLAAELGSDVAFFFNGGAAELRGGRGETLLQKVGAPHLHVVLALPGLHVSTAEVYRSLSVPKWVAETQPGSAENHSVTLPLSPGSNGLEYAARDLVPELDQIGRALAQIAAFTLSGSGSTYFCACADLATAQQVAEQAQKIVPQVVLTQIRQSEAAWCTS
jgi:4-diphosphocytidyl-2-C-methyl-D-erythritol kinase